MKKYIYALSEDSQLKSQTPISWFDQQSEVRVMEAENSSTDVHSVMMDAVFGCVLSLSSLMQVTFARLAVTLFMLAATSVWVCSWRLKRSEGKRPPGPLGFLPFFFGDGNNFLTAHYHKTTKEWYEQMKKMYGSVFKATVMGRTTIFMDGPVGNKFIFSASTDEKLVKGYWPTALRHLLGPHASVSKQGEAYVAHRRHLMQAFLGMDAIREYITFMERKVKEHVQQEWMSKEDDTVIRAYDVVEMLVFDVVVELCMGVSDLAELKKLRPDFEILMYGMFTNPIRLPGFTFYKSLQARKRILNVLRNCMVKRREDLKEGRATPNQDFLSVLLTQPDIDGHTFSEPEMLDRMVQLVVAGSSTTSSTLASVLRNTAEHPDVYEKLQKEHASIAAKKVHDDALTMDDIRSMTFTWSVVEESMRLDPVLQIIPREVNTDFKYKDFMIYKGDVVVSSVMASHWNEDLFKDWQKFDPSRFEKGKSGEAPPFSFTPFGLGHRICPGKEFAKVMIMIVLHHLFKNIKLAVVNPDEKIIYWFAPLYTDRLPLRITKLRAI